MAKATSLFYPDWLVFNPVCLTVKVQEDPLKKKLTPRELPVGKFNRYDTHSMALFGKSDSNAPIMVPNTARTGFEVYALHKDHVYLKHPDILRADGAPCVFEMDQTRFLRLHDHGSLATLTFQVVATASGTCLLMCEQERAEYEILSLSQIKEKLDTPLEVGAYYTGEQTSGKFLYAGICSFTDKALFIPPIAKSSAILWDSQGVLPTVKVGESHLSPALFDAVLEQSHILSNTAEKLKRDAPYTLQTMTVGQFIHNNADLWEGMKLTDTRGFVFKTDMDEADELLCKILWNFPNMQRAREKWISEGVPADQVMGEGIPLYLDKFLNYISTVAPIRDPEAGNYRGIQRIKAAMSRHPFNLTTSHRETHHALLQYTHYIQQNGEVMALGLEYSGSIKHVNLILYSKANGNRYRSYIAQVAVDSDYTFDLFMDDQCYVISRGGPRSFSLGARHNDAHGFLTELP